MEGVDYEQPSGTFDPQAHWVESGALALMFAYHVYTKAAAAWQQLAVGDYRRLLAV